MPIKVVFVGGKELARDLKVDGRKVKDQYMKKGLARAALKVERHAKMTYLRRPKDTKGQDLIHLGGQGRLRSSLTRKIDTKRGLAKIGWWKLAYAGVVAEPPKGRTKTIIKPKGKKFLFFALTKKARSVRDQFRSAKSFRDKRGRKGKEVAGKRFFEGEDYAFAKQVVIEARFPLSRALSDKKDEIAKEMMTEFKVLRGRKHLA